MHQAEKLPAGKTRKTFRTGASMFCRLVGAIFGAAF